MIAFYAEPSCLEEFDAFVAAHRTALSAHRLTASVETASGISDQRGLDLELLEADDSGGLRPLARRTATGRLRALIAFVKDAPDFVAKNEGLFQLARETGIAIALNRPAAEILIEQLQRKRFAYLIFNPVAGQGDPAQERAEIEQRLRGALDLIVWETTPERDADALAREALLQKPDLIIASGGDGTLSAVAAELVGKSTPLALIPRGTANAFAVCLFGEAVRLFPIGLSCNAILEGNVSTVDAARCNGRVMILLAGVGIEAGMIARASRELKNQYGALAYVIGAWQHLREHPPFEAIIEIDGVSHHFQTRGCVVANAAPPSSLFAQGNGPPDYQDGVLDITVLLGLNDAFETVATMFDLAAAGISGAKTGDNVVHLFARQARIRTQPPQPLAVDGELLAPGTLEVECLPRSLRVITMAGAPK